MNAAYDYERQRWAQGPDALKLRLKQLEEEREILKGPRAAEFIRFNGGTGTIAETLEWIETQIEALKVAMG